MSDRQQAIYIGTMGWTYKDWLGSFYPHDGRFERLSGVLCAGL